MEWVNLQDHLQVMYLHQHKHCRLVVALVPRYNIHQQQQQQYQYLFHHLYRHRHHLFVVIVVVVFIINTATIIILSISIFKDGLSLKIKNKHPYSSVLQRHTELMKLCRCGIFRRLNSSQIIFSGLVLKDVQYLPAL